MSDSRGLKDLTVDDLMLYSQLELKTFQKKIEEAIGKLENSEKDEESLVKFDACPFGTFGTERSSEDQFLITDYKFVLNSKLLVIGILNSENSNDVRQLTSTEKEIAEYYGFALA